MKINKVILGLCLVSILILIGCAQQQTKYVCPDGTIVSDASFCPKEASNSDSVQQDAQAVTEKESNSDSIQQDVQAVTEKKTNVDQLSFDDLLPQKEYNCKISTLYSDKPAIEFRGLWDVNLDLNSGKLRSYCDPDNYGYVLVAESSNSNYNKQILGSLCEELGWKEKQIPIKSETVNKCSESLEGISLIYWGSGKYFFIVFSGQDMDSNKGIGIHTEDVAMEIIIKYS